MPAEKPANPLFLFCAPGRSPGRLGDVRWSGGLSRRPNGSRTVQPPSRWRVPQTANPGRLPCQGPPYLAVARQRPQTDIDISNTPPDDAPRSSRAFCRLASFELIYQSTSSRPRALTSRQRRSHHRPHVGRASHALRLRSVHPLGLKPIALTRTAGLKPRSCVHYIHPLISHQVLVGLAADHSLLVLWHIVAIASSTALLSVGRISTQSHSLALALTRA